MEFNLLINLLLFIILSIIIIFCIFVYLYLTWNFNYWKKRNVKGPKPKIIEGTFPSVINQKRHIAYDFDDIYNQYKKTEKFVGIFMTKIPQLMAIEPSLTKSIYITNFKYFHDNESSLWIDRKREPIPGYNPFNLTGSDWKEKRSEIVPALTLNRIKASYPIIQQICSKMIDYLRTLEKKSLAKRVNAKDLSTRFTAEVVINYTYGIDAKTFDVNDESIVLKMSKRMIDQVFKLIGHFFFVSLLPIIRKIYYVRFFPKDAEQFFFKIMKDTIDMRIKNHIERNDLLDYLIKLKEKKNLTILDLATHTMTFFFDGFETSSIVISHLLLLLAKHEYIQEKLRNEILSASDNEENLDFDTLIELPYLEQCFCESLRIFPPILVASKMCTEECELENYDGRKLKVQIGETIHIPVYSFHHDKKYYPKPFEFIPERFSEEQGGSKKYKEMGVYYPFGEGPRICLGMKFGMAQSKAAVASIIRNFRITVNSKTRDDFVLDPKCFLCMLDGGIWLDFESIM